MNNFVALDTRKRRNLLAHGMNAFTSPFHKNYCTDTAAEMKTSYGDSLFINTFHLIPETLKTNLADSVVTLDDRTAKTNMASQTKGFVNNGCNMNRPQSNTKSDYYPSLAGIASFFSGVFNVMGAMFQKRANSPVQYYDCFEHSFEDHHQMTPSPLAWQAAKREDQNKNGRAEADEFADETYTDFSSDMSKEFRSITTHCEDKLNQVRLLLSNNTVKRTVRQRRPKRAFHEASSADDLYEDAFTAEDFISLANETFLEYCSPCNLHHEQLNEIDSPRIRTEIHPVKESIEIVKNMPSKDCDEIKSNITLDRSVEDSLNSNMQVVSSCEDKVAKLKALVQKRRQRKNNSVDSKVYIGDSIENVAKTEATPIPKLCTESQNQNKTEVIFTKDIEIPTTPNSPNVLDPSSYFDEVTGRFYSSSATDSEDSFQIVFSDSPRIGRKRIASDCDSEDSFIVFEESPDSCYTSNEVFGDDSNNITNLSSDSENSDSDCESDFDSGVNTITLSHCLSRTFGDLTDGSLYEDSRGEDEVDCAFVSVPELPREVINETNTSTPVPESTDVLKRGVLVDETKKREKRKLPAKKVHFSPLPPKVHVMRVWAFAARQARAGHWERHALDRERFRRRIADVEVAVSWVLKPQHRSRVMFQRFMPWWNAQKRKELAERKQREEEERRKKEEEVLDIINTENRLSVSKEPEKNTKNIENASCNMKKTDDMQATKRVFKKNCKTGNDSLGGERRAQLDDNIEIIESVTNNIEHDKDILDIGTGKISEDKVIVKTKDKMCNGVADVNCKVGGISINGVNVGDRNVLKEGINITVNAHNSDSHITQRVKGGRASAGRGRGGGGDGGDRNLNRILNGADDAGRAPQRQAT